MRKKYKRRSRLFRFIGLLIVLLSTVGAFVAYQSVIDWENFKQNNEIFVVVNEGTLKLNFAIAIPLFVGIGVFLLVVLKRNKDFFADKYSMGLIVTLLLLYLIYSIIEVVMFSLIGASMGSIIDDYIFRPIAKYYNYKADEQKDIDNEYEKEKRRIKARQQAREELDGSV